MNGYSEVASPTSWQGSSTKKDASSSTAAPQVATPEPSRQRGQEFFTAGQDVDLTSRDNPYIVSSQLKGAGESIAYLLDLYMEGNGIRRTKPLVWRTELSGRLGDEGFDDHRAAEAVSDADMVIIKQAVEDIRSGRSTCVTCRKKWRGSFLLSDIAVCQIGGKAASVALPPLNRCCRAC